MDCREFRDRHSNFVDGMLSDAEAVAMQLHLAECERCARHDTAMRRGLLVLRNLPAIEPSADFLDRLNDRLRQLKQADARAAMYRGPGVGSFMAIATGVVMAGFLAAALLNSAAPARDLTLAPVVAMHPPAPPPPLMSSGFVASASAGLPVWPAAMMGVQAPVHFASAELQFPAWSR
ncbi:MAG TPA: zf-HC2 domain-containing protein [Gemmatimonadaceae bacterium]|nr:zf-HC2 domain-containing protein [Gemmatimonadaceae bacterium]